MNWKAVNLKSPYERDQNLLDPYNFETLLLEVACNIKDITEESVKAQAMESIRIKYHSAIEILNDNLTNITNQARKERNIK